MKIISFSEYLKESVKQNLLKLSKDVRKLDALKDTMSREAVVEAIEKILESLSGDIDSTLTKFKRLMRDYTKDSSTKFLTSTKKIAGIISKILDRNKKFTELGDLVRGAVLFKTQEELDEFVKKFSRKHKDLIVKYESKDKGGDAKFGYYGSHHFDLNIDGLIVELQAMTIKLWNYKDAAHKIYKSARDNSSGPTKQDMQQSKDLFFKGNTQRRVYEEVEEDLFEYDSWVLPEGCELDEDNNII